MYALVLSTVGYVTRFVPEVVLPQSPQTIDAKARWHPFDITTAALEGQQSFGVLAPRVKTLAPTELKVEVEAAVFDDFARNQVLSVWASSEAGCHCDWPHR